MSSIIQGVGPKQLTSDAGTDRILVRVHIPSLNDKKVVDAPRTVPIWYMKKILCLRTNTETPNLENYGFYLPSCPQLCRPGKWLRENQRLSSYLKGALVTV